MAELSKHWPVGRLCLLVQEAAVTRNAARDTFAWKTAPTDPPRLLLFSMEASGKGSALDELRKCPRTHSALVERIWCAAATAACAAHCARAGRW
jgi:hypothetical protein